MEREDMTRVSKLLEQIPPFEETKPIETVLLAFSLENTPESLNNFLLPIADSFLMQSHLRGQWGRY
jgi:hypothetical protein